MDGRTDGLTNELNGGRAGGRTTILLCSILVYELNRKLLNEATLALFYVISRRTAKMGDKKIAEAQTHLRQAEKW